MSFIIWYKVQIEEDASAGGLGAIAGAIASLAGVATLPLAASNDVFSGQYVCDTSITLSMISGAYASSFDVTLINLPLDAAQLLKSKYDSGFPATNGDPSAPQPPLHPLHVKVYLGYFEDAPSFSLPDPVLEGAVLELWSEVNANGILETHLRGQEIAGFRLGTRTKIAYSQAGAAAASSFLDRLAADANVTVKPGHGLTMTLTDYTLKADNGLKAIETLAKSLPGQREAPVVIGDNQIFMLNAVGGGDPITFSPNKDLVLLNDRAVSDQDQALSQLRQQNGQLQTTSRSSRKLTVLGNPDLRVGMTAKVDIPNEPPGAWRIHDLKHVFSSSSGYTCDVVLLAAKQGELARLPVGANGVVQRIQDIAERTQAQRASIDVGEISAYETGGDKKHLATLNYGQTPSDNAVAPSVETPVDDSTQLHSKPIASVFAFHQCGLVVPVYPKMRALLAHNQGSANDSLVTGFLWGENPRLAPPPNQAGDYWLCLPTSLAPTGLPQGKTVNDLTDASGRRIVQAEGLHIMVGHALLADLGSRPSVTDDLTGQVVIEHKSGTKITIADDGSVTVATKGQKLSLTNGSVTLALDGTSVGVS